MMDEEQYSAAGQAQMIKREFYEREHGEHFPVDLYAIADNLCIEYYVEEIEDASVVSYLTKDGLHTTVHISASLDSQHQRLQLARQIGFFSIYAATEDKITNLTRFINVERPKTLREKWLNEFTAEMVMPEKEVAAQRLVNSDAHQLAEFFDVPIEMVSQRISCLGLV